MSKGSFVNRFNELEKETYNIGMSVQQKLSDKATADARVSKCRVRIAIVILLKYE